MATTAEILTDVVDGHLNGKPFYASKTLWANVLAIVALGIQIKFGFVIGIEWQTLGLSVINLGLRLVTKQPVVLS